MKTIAIIGSGNLTAGGLVNNTEIAFQLEFSNEDEFSKKLDDTWDAFRSLAQPVTLPEIRKLKDQQALGSETEKEPNNSKDGTKLFLTVKKSVAKRPLYLKILDVKNDAERQSLLTKMDPLTEKPKKLYLQILEYETGPKWGCRISRTVTSCDAIGLFGVRQIKVKRPLSTLDRLLSKSI